ncbi:SGNH hydrolase [Amycolatopsis mediterranei S699]|uniref:SGNH hydrolase n=2 Tax=Amycolatopsis mediterranei TaxID=33910 RepID=A0A0H3DG56_AMYMU|nr:SGNH/GDSL hydrolase family protein [Amycolatopsis mediterranei]ADJ49850.1 SGNH hydrolase [Amycolatopsis mediterranei U32]AEK46840.1 SGNH hydrolase [Amycolatopsis mediterranei S699]AFO81558.1 SGNH hydrolase [Amycolatopsis mediterranei S699]AGT88687.1 SGNH hydrolase [Amycolatopsis mediterranei RB]KDO07900.1 SGNH hydrolase [Amycolatopsis mediterranei]
MSDTNTGWVRSWGAAPQSAYDGLGSLDGHPPLADVTLRQVVRLSGGGRRVRVRFTNEFGTAPLTIGAAQVGLAVPGGGVRDGRALTFSGAAAVTIPTGAPMLSDPVELPAAALTELSVSLYLPERVETCTCHDPVLDTGWTIPGDAVAAPALPANATVLPVRALISAVDVVPGGPASAIVVVGDSRTDGAGSTPDTHHSWPELLAARGAGFVVNQGISGNRLLNDGAGTAVLARFDRDVLATPGLGFVVLSVGGNDLAISFAPRDDGPLAGFLKMFPGAPVTTEDVIAGHRQLVARARERGVRVYATTMAPLEGADAFTPECETARQVVNEWIRTGGEFDAVLDFDAVWRDPEHPSRIREDFHSGDHLHGSDAGYWALADSVDLSLFG